MTALHPSRARETAPVPDLVVTGPVDTSTAGPNTPVRWVRLLLAAVLPMAALLAAGAAYTTVRGHDLIDPVIDPASAFGYSGRWGALVQVGIMCWAAAAALLLHGSASRALPAVLRSWLLRAGLATTVLALDDALMVHERLGSRVPGGEPLVLGALGLVALALLLPGCAVVWRDRARPLVVAAALLLGGSVAVDLVEEQVAGLFGAPREAAIYLEECLKLLGIATWVVAAVALTRTARAEQAHH